MIFKWHLQKIFPKSIVKIMNLTFLGLRPDFPWRHSFLHIWIPNKIICAYEYLIMLEMYHRNCLINFFHLIIEHLILINISKYDHEIYSFFKNCHYLKPSWFNINKQYSWRLWNNVSLMLLYLMVMCWCLSYSHVLHLHILYAGLCHTY